MTVGLTQDRDGFFDQFTTMFSSVGDDLEATEEQRQAAISLCRQSAQRAALACMESFGTTAFRDDLPTITVPTLVIQGDGAGIVPFEGSGALTPAAVAQSGLVLIDGAPHGFIVSHRDAFNDALLTFLSR